MDKVADRLDAINHTLEKLTGIAQAAFDAIPKPENRLMRMLKTVVLVAGALGIFTTAEIIRQWITGGG